MDGHDRPTARRGLAQVEVHGRGLEIEQAFCVSADFSPDELPRLLGSWAAPLAKRVLLDTPHACAKA
jgi:hypothetical protein